VSIIFYQIRKETGIATGKTEKATGITGNATGITGITARALTKFDKLICKKYVLFFHLK